MFRSLNVSAWAGCFSGQGVVGVIVGIAMCLHSAAVCAQGEIATQSELGDVDLSGDNNPDIVRVIGATTGPEGVTIDSMDCTCHLLWTPGRIEVVGSTDGVVHASIIAENITDDLGRSVSATADLNGDGAIDLIVGAPVAQTTGRSYVFYGPFSGGTILTVDDAALVLQSDCSGDLEFGHHVGPLADQTGDGTPEIRVRCFRGPLVEERAVTHIFDGASGHHLVAINSQLVDDMWEPISGDLDDDGDVDSTDQNLLLNQLGRVNETGHQLWADVNGEGVVAMNDFASQVSSVGAHDGLDVVQIAVSSAAELADAGQEPCNCEPGKSAEWCVFTEQDGFTCLTYGHEDDDGDGPDLFGCMRESPVVNMPFNLNTCLFDDTCYLALMYWLTQMAEDDENCDEFPPEIVYVDCSACVSAYYGFYDAQDNKIYICVNLFTAQSRPDWCYQLKLTMLEEMFHAYQYCNPNSRPLAELDQCDRIGCAELSAARYIECRSDPDPCRCAYEKMLASLRARFRYLDPSNEDQVAEYVYWRACYLSWLEIMNSPTTSQCEPLEDFCKYGNESTNPQPNCHILGSGGQSGGSSGLDSGDSFRRR